MTDKTIIGVDLGGTNVRSGRIEAGRIHEISSQKVRSDGTQDEVLEDLVRCISQVMQPGVDGIGVGVPAVVDTREGVVSDAVNLPSWKEVPLKRILEERFRRPVRVNNDANCFAAGEWYYGKGKGVSDLVGLILGTGVAGGLICNGRLYEGRNCGAGEFGMLPYLDKNLEFYASGNFFRYSCGQSGEDVCQQALSGDPDALRVFHEYGRHVSWVIRSVLFTVDPQMIILGGSVSKAFPFFRDSLWSHLQDFPYKPVIRNIRIEPSETENIALLGAAALFYSQAATSSGQI
ncbi:MAG TPA: ROK family protein [Sphingobacteriaceae bacterium]